MRQAKGAGRVHHRAGRESRARHRRDPAPARRRGRAPRGVPAAEHRAQVLRPHRASRCSMGRRDDGQPGERAVGAAEERDHRRAVHRVLQARRRTTSRRRSPGRTTASRGARSTRSSSTSRRARRSTCGTASTATGSSSTCGACSSWTTPSTCCPHTCASCAAWSTRTTCRSTSRARSCRRAATSTRSAPAARSACSALLEDLAEKDKAKYASFWNEFGRVLKEGVGEDPANRERDREAAALRVARTTTAKTQERLARRLRRRA